MPLVGKVQWRSFDKAKFGNVMSLQMKLTKHVMARNVDKLKKYLAFCIQEWPVFSECPIDTSLIKEAIDVIRDSSRDSSNPSI
jgi:hypothetical protein